MPLASVADAVAAYRAGQFVIIVDDEDRENEGDLAIAAEAVTPAAIAFMVRHAGGLICVPMQGEDLDRLGLPLMVPPDRNGTQFGTAFTVSVEARAGVTTGISAFDRAHTIQVLTDPAAQPSDLVQPGHIFPLRCHPDGVLARRGQTEAAVALAALAGMRPAAVICEIMDDDGRMARLPSLERFAARHQIPLVSIADLVAYRIAQRDGASAQHRARSLPSVQRVLDTQLPTAVGRFRLAAYLDRARPGADPHLALIAGDLSGTQGILTRVHSECLTGDVFGSGRCDCGPQLGRAMALIAEHGQGVLLYLRQEGRGIGLLNKLRAYALQDDGLDTVEANRQLGFPADARDYQIAADILRDLGVSRVRLLTNNPHKLAALAEHGIAVVERVPLVVPPEPTNRHYLQTKQQKLGHWLPVS
ncbi:MAG TPA: GTP cyclohydrolase II [Thermomicrobiaceae bacterium]|nr:GTP cyclohydrolase II [Thermomicrobiaceae bacterium]